MNHRVYPNVNKGTTLIEKLEGFSRRNSVNHCYINKDVYRLLYDREFYYIAYNNIRNNDGAETKGSDGTSLHGFSEHWIDDIISSLRDNSYQPKPSKTTHIPKKNGKMRKLSFPNGRDKLLQECVRIILECIYESTFSNSSHGFRPNRSIHSAVAQVSTWKATTWFIEGDISVCFDEVDHRILENILRERINDERFINLINKLLKVGYFDSDMSLKPTKQGATQGSVTSPILANIYLDKLDRYMEEVTNRDTLGNYRKQNPEYAKLRYQLNKAIKAHDVPNIKRLRKLLKDTPSNDLMDCNFRRIHYVRYADDFLIGTISSKAYAVALKQEIKTFLEVVLHLRLNDEKTKITNTKHDKAHFLGFIITKGSIPNIQILMNTKTMINRLHHNGFCDENGYPVGNTKLFRFPLKDIITYGNQVLRGVMNGNQGNHNFYDGWRIQYIIQYSIAKTIARKYDISMRQVFKKYGDNLTCTYLNSKGITKQISLALFKSFKRDKTFFPNWLTKIKDTVKYEYDARNRLSNSCYICSNDNYNMMFHRRRKGLLKLPYSNIVKEMLRINRRQICLCVHCFDNVELNQLELNQIKRPKPI